MRGLRGSIVIGLGLGLLACGPTDEAVKDPAPVSDAPEPEPEPKRVPDVPVPDVPPPAPQQEPTPPEPAVVPLAEESRTSPSRGDLQIERAEADALMARLEALPKFPLALSELEAHLGRPVRRHFNPESHDPTFVHDKGGTGINIGGTAIHHPSGDEDTPLLFELRSKYYARYDDARKFRDRPPFAADDPVIDLISFSDRYANGDAPPLPAGSLPFEGNYTYTAEQWHIKPLHDGFVSLYRHDRARNPRADRWVHQITSERGLYHTPAEVEQVETMLLDIVEVIRTGKDMPEHLAALERTYADGYDLGILTLGLGSYNIRFFDADLTEGDRAGGFLRDEGKTRALYINAYIEGEAKVALPNFFGAFGFKEYTVEPSKVPGIAPGNREGGLLYYGSIILEKKGWRIRAVGFYPVKDGKAQTVITLPEFLVTELSISHTVPLRRKKKK